MSMLHAAPVALSETPPTVRRISQADLNWALAEGWRDFLDKRGDIVLIALIYPVIGFIAAALAFDYQDLLPMFFPLAAGLSILGPAVACGFYEIARRREAGLESTWRHFIDPLRRPGRLSLALLTAGLASLFACWLCIAWIIWAATLGTEPPAGLRAFASALFTTPQGWTLIVLGNLVGFVFAAVVLISSVVSFPMIVDKSVDPLTAVETSIRAVRENPREIASWGLRVAALLLLGCLPAFVGLIVVLPVLGYATWHLYVLLVER